MRFLYWICFSTGLLIFLDAGAAFPENSWKNRQERSSTIAGAPGRGDQAVEAIEQTNEPKIVKSFTISINCSIIETCYIFL